MIDLEKLNSTPRWQIPDLCKDKFCEIYEQKFKKPAEPFFEQQKALFVSEVNAGSYAKQLQRASAFSVMNAFMFLAIYDLSLERCSTTTCYLECRNIKAGTDQNGQAIYASVAYITVTGYGEILLRQRAKQIRGADSPVVIYDCDKIEFGERDGHKFLNYTKAFPRPAGSKVVGCYIRIVKIDGSVDYYLMDLGDIARLKGYSAKSNGGRYANALYGREADCSDIDSGFLKSKCVKHAFKGYPRLELTDAGALESDKDENAKPQDAAPAEVTTTADVPSDYTATPAPEEDNGTDTPFD